MPPSPRIEACADDTPGDFAAVIEGLDAYRARTGVAPLMLGGWEAEDSAIHPPRPLLAALRAIRPRLAGYTYAREFGVVRERAAALCAPDLCLDGGPLSADAVSCVQNSTQGLLLALASLKDEGVTRVVVAAPCYFAAVEAARKLGLAVEIVPAADFLTGALDSDRLVASYLQAFGGRAARTAVLVTNPAYSVGVEHEPRELLALRAALPAQTTLLIDETRLGLHWHRESPWYRAAYPGRTLLLRSPSKIFFVNGLKCSLLFGDPALLRRVERLGEALVGSCPAGLQEVALAYLDAWARWRGELAAGEAGPYRIWRRRTVAALRRNRDRLAPSLVRHGFMLAPVNSGPHVLAAARDAGERRLPAPLAAARACGVLLMDATYAFHSAPQWSGFRVNLSGDATAAEEALERIRGL